MRDARAGEGRPLPPEKLASLEQKCSKAEERERRESTAHWTCRGNCLMAAVSVDDFDRCNERCRLPTPRVACDDILAPEEAENVLHVHVQRYPWTRNDIGPDESCDRVFNAGGERLILWLGVASTTALAEELARFENGTHRRERAFENDVSCGVQRSRGRFYVHVARIAPRCDWASLEMLLDVVIGHLP